MRRLGAAHPTQDYRRVCSAATHVVCDFQTASISFSTGEGRLFGIGLALQAAVCIFPKLGSASVALATHPTQDYRRVYGVSHARGL
ncbi:hypothetical protein [Kingella potus]|uniref:hypothetical protein n=1 Tax=Kingella potus TaxID=265175 RepID=UPI001FD1ECE2|nr:hypothetical protein [Kingella potus]UOP01337.1 hypothetical protein LVJ84_03570 [Kingella potus]